MKIIGDEKILIDEIISDAERKRDQSVKKAEKEAKKIIEAAEKDTIEQKEKILNDARKKAEETENYVLALIPQTIKQTSIKMFNSLVDEVITEFPEFLKSLDNGKRKNIELTFLKNNIHDLEKGEYTIYLAKNSQIKKSDIEALEKEYSLKLKLEKSQDIDFGVFISGDNDRVNLDITLKGKINQDMDEVRFLIYNVLFNNISNSDEWRYTYRKEKWYKVK